MLMGNHEGQGKFVVQGSDRSEEPRRSFGGDLPNFVELRGRGLLLPAEHDRVEVDGVGQGGSADDGRVAATRSGKSKAISMGFWKKAEGAFDSVSGARPSRCFGA